MSTEQNAFPGPPEPNGEFESPFLEQLVMESASTNVARVREDREARRPFESPFLDEFRSELEEEGGGALLEPGTYETSPDMSSCEPGRFVKNRLRVVVWRGRTTPGRRRLPRRLKLAILSRGRIRLPTERVRWLLNVHKDLPWVKRLTVDLPQVLPEVDVTIELFFKQRLSLTTEQTGAVFEQYLKLRHAKHLRSCPFFAAWWNPATRRTTFEKLLGIRLRRLFQRPRVRLRARRPVEDPRRFLLLVYASFPQGIRQFMTPDTGVEPLPPPPPVPKNKMPPLAGRTSATAFYNLRMEPNTGATSLGEMMGIAIPVSVINKARNEGYEWYQIVLRQKLNVKKSGKVITLPAATTCWVVGGGLSVNVADWNFFRFQLRQLEEDNQSLSLNARIIKLRQMSHEKTTPFDAIIGTQSGNVYLDDLPFVADAWQMFKDYEAVRMPDGRWVDIHHIFVGLDVLRRPEKARRIAGTRVGTNWAATTWAGDIGAAAADATIKQLEVWEANNPRATEATRIRLYYNTRASEWDLLGDIDVWGINALRSADLDSIDKLLTAYYHKKREGGARTLTAQRQRAVELFLDHYGFTYDHERDIRQYPALIKQPGPSQRIRTEIHLFGRVWITKRKPFRKSKTPKYVAEMSRLFLVWLEDTAIENGATVQ